MYCSRSQTWCLTLFKQIDYSVVEEEDYVTLHTWKMQLSVIKEEAIWIAISCRTSWTLPEHEHLFPNRQPWFRKLDHPQMIWRQIIIRCCNLKFCHCKIYGDLSRISCNLNEWHVMITCHSFRSELQSVGKFWLCLMLHVNLHFVSKNYDYVITSFLNRDSIFM